MLKPILTEEQLKQINIWLSDCTHFVICAHISPDGDAIGSSLGFASFLRSLGKEVTIVMPNQFPEFLHWMSGTDTILLADRDTEQVKEAFAAAEIICCLDFNDLSRIEELGEIARNSSADFWLIDHHLDPGDFSKVSVSFPNMSSTCEVVFRIIYQLGGFGTIGSLFPPMWDWYMFWKMTAFLSIILAFMNILPIPALDGGHVLFLLYEIITRRKPSEQFMIRAEYVGFGILILLMVVANLNDILRWLGFM